MYIKDLSDFLSSNNVKHVYANAEYEINEQNRDTQFLSEADKLNVSVHMYDGDLIAPPGSVTTKNGEMYKVFTPFKNEWLKQHHDTHFYFRELPNTFSEVQFQDHALLKGDGSSDKWPVEDETLSQVIHRFIDEKLTEL